MKSAIVAVIIIALATPTYAQCSRFDELANLPFVENRPTAETAQALRDEFLLISTR